MTAASLGPVVVLVGPMGAGKSTVAELLGAAWGEPVRDTDRDVEAAEGRSIADIVVDSGEETFRALERAAVAEALAAHRGVLALGGGAVLDPATREALADQPVVFLRVGLADAVVEKFGGDSVAETARNCASYLDALPRL